MALCIVALAAVPGCGGDDDEETVVETTTVIETVPTTPPETEPPATETEPPPTQTETTEPPPEDEGAEGDDESGAVTAPAHCGRLAFEKNTDSGAIAIAVVGTDCGTGKAVARAAQGRSDDLSYESNGFQCRGVRRGKAALASVDWVCIRNDDFIRFGTT